MSKRSGRVKKKEGGLKPPLRRAKAPTLQKHLVGKLRRPPFHYQGKRKVAGTNSNSGRG